MKKFIYMILFALATALTTVSCTEEEVAPVADTHNGGGANNDGGKL